MIGGTRWILRLAAVTSDTFDATGPGLLTGSGR